LQEGAHLYVCGDAHHMANDVQEALLQILREHGGYSAERASEELLELQRARRYQRDVY
jgi:sulfite reductase (NADPH) flavoprotein alpha-component